MILTSALGVLTLIALAVPALATAAPKPAVLTFKTATVGAPGNPAAGIVPFTDAVYRNCSEAPAPKGPRAPVCQMVGSVKQPYGIGQLEVTVGQYVAFLNTVDPAGKNKHKLYSSNESGSAWPRFGQIDFSSALGAGRHYMVAAPEWADKPYGFANFLRSATRSTTAKCSPGRRAARPASATSPIGCGSPAVPRSGCTT
jgi:hypothetical protein